MRSTVSVSEALIIKWCEWDHSPPYNGAGVDRVPIRVNHKKEEPVIKAM
jgi:hypothetical protein